MKTYPIRLLEKKDDSIVIECGDVVCELFSNGTYTGKAAAGAPFEIFERHWRMDEQVLLQFQYDDQPGWHSFFPQLEDQQTISTIIAEWLIEKALLE